MILPVSLQFFSQYHVTKSTTNVYAIKGAHKKISYWKQLQIFAYFFIFIKIILTNNQDKLNIKKYYFSFMDCKNWKNPQRQKC